MRKNGVPFSGNGSGKYFGRAQQYFHNGKAILKTIPIQYDLYQSEKKVREACGILYLAGIQAVNGFLVGQGFSPHELPKNLWAYEDVWEALKIHNGKLRAAFHVVYQNLHVAGYYQGIQSVKTIKEGVEKLRFLIERLVP